MVNLIKWYLWRRWHFIHWCMDPYMEINGELINTMYKVNFAGCRETPHINRDMAMIASRIKK